MFPFNFKLFSRRGKLPSPRCANLIEALASAQTEMQTQTILSSDETNALIVTYRQLENDEFHFYGWPSVVKSLLDALWVEGLHPKEYFRRLSEKASNRESRFLYSRRPPEWLVGLADEFINSVSGIDKKLQGRVMEAITKITRGPTTIVGDTMKPLSKNLSGLWRYRIGDYRLVYQPDVENKRILLLSFGSRGGIYESH